MQYHLTEEIPADDWEQNRDGIVADVRQRALHDLSAQNPDSAITLTEVRHSVQRAATASGAATALRVDFVCEYTLGGAPNQYDA